MMQRLLPFGVIALGVVVGARRLAWHFREFDFAKMIERMPENAPPKWMFRNISAIRENAEHSRRNTERILGVLQSERSAPADRAAHTAR